MLSPVILNVILRKPMPALRHGVVQLNFQGQMIVRNPGKWRDRESNHTWFGKRRTRKSRSRAVPARRNSRKSDDRACSITSAFEICICVFFLIFFFIPVKSVNSATTLLDIRPSPGCRTTPESIIRQHVAWQNTPYNPSERGSRA